MALTERPQATLTLYELRWISGKIEGACWIRAIDADDAIAELEAHAGFYGCPHERPLIVLVLPSRRISRLYGRV